jgi:hypothetical protein
MGMDESMLKEADFRKLALEIETQGYSRERAAHYAMLIGDTPCFEDDGWLCVVEHGKIIARLKPLEFFTE